MTIGAVAGDRAFYRRWIVTNALAESAGLGSTFAIGRLFAPRLEGITGAAAVFGAAALAVVLGAFLEGVVVGAAQERVLRRRLAGLRRWSWTLATAAGAGLAWLVGMVPSTVAALTASEATTASPVEPTAIVRLGLAAALGMAAGPILGVAQWTVLRRLVPSAGRWLWANALAWGVGMPVIFTGMDLVPWTSHPAAIAVAVYTLCGAAGLVVGGIHGRVLIRMLRDRDRTDQTPRTN